MAKLDKVVKLYKGDAEAAAGTTAELNHYRLQGWGTKKPAGGKKDEGKTPATPSAGAKKN